ncbi:MAG: protein-glutamate O-methyltransferase CheR [Deltaproteobacteria bacterium]|nr:protein-glutamate O-methyltransferase CheR [Deltaproteobacteria bacterium]
MTIISVSVNEFKELQYFIEKQCGIQVGDNKKYLIETRLSRILFDLRMTSFTELINKLKIAPPKDLVVKIVDAMTTNETLWFRDSHPWQIFRDIIIPQLVSNANGRKIRIWSAACSTGQEPYTISMLIKDLHRKGILKSTPDKFEITATDISPSALFLAMSGRYDNISMKRGFTDEWVEFKTRYFSDKGRFTEINPEIKKIIKFKRFNLQDSFIELGNFDMVFLRNVAIYFSKEFKKELFGKIHKTLNSGGLMMLGSSETLPMDIKGFKPKMHNRTTVFTKEAP